MIQVEYATEMYFYIVIIIWEVVDLYLVVVIIIKPDYNQKKLVDLIRLDLLV